ncbi:hypothetical protein RFI_08252 [Reticulomyxa filosa]|uniref:Uncharacterized protein n=1 Tax=Reticulomyxa filosa TaxID=46433 RepID=X6NT24_RETFI|nr:hypothetical protein RFI_08252 [Reticulomyxa filosa]|eukprot:ETO28879.1 hypothetical protein RFI_08252 [Reticulomyxa filosa]
METSKLLHTFNEHKDSVWCVDISPLQSYSFNDDNNKSNSIGLIGGNGYTICSGSADKTISIWDIETTKQCSVLKGHEEKITCVKYGLHENLIFSSSSDKSIRLWDLRSGKQVQIFNGHIKSVNVVEYSPLVTRNNYNVICSGADDGIVRFWDIRTNKKRLHVIKGDNKGEDKILCIKFFQLKNKIKQKSDTSDCIKLCYGSSNGFIRIWGQ